MKMEKILLCTLVLLVTLNSVASQSQSSTCSKYAFKSSNMGNNASSPATNFQTCVDLPVLSSFLHWTYHPTNGTLDIAYRHTGVGPASSKWVVWAINPTGKSMVGSQCLVAYRNPKDGSMVVYTSPITGYGTTLAKGDLSFEVPKLSAVEGSNEIIIFATLVVPKNATTLNQVWQDGPLSSDGRPLMHSPSGDNLRSFASLDLLSGVTVTTGTATGSSLKYIHGMLNAVSWGILMPTGGIIARYMRVFPQADPAWFYLHVGCQMSAYFLGVAGWATGLKLGARSQGVEHSKHRIIGITLFCLATIQMFALLIRPAKDHKYRIYWNVYHHSVAYTIIILSIVNIFEGLEILSPDVIWKNTYIGVIGTLGFIAVILEAFTWYVVIARKRATASDSGNKQASFV